ncbi:MAG: UDP-N-acetylmuramoyl-L-alanyl-D-glutamate--2,6-diaminopimelate ligase [Firmicutes bacterium]|nr:UDP-N-acetylmuramoyl-L-alanyl-D-glutamate--2,6-diaminopimelate ligase [Bacillota bacterium]
MISRKLAALAKRCNLPFQGDKDITVRDITNNSREVKPGSLFIAICGYSDDGHEYINDAARRGACAVVVQKPCPDLAIPQILVSDSRKAQANLACEFFDNPSKELTMVGITGTNGKTTSTFLVDSILRTAGIRTGIIGTLYNKINGEILPTSHTTPDAIACQRLLRQMVNAGVTHVVMEVSSHALVMKRVDGVEFAVGAITNISPDHLDLHTDMDDYIRSKQLLFEMLPPSAWAVYNLDDMQATRVALRTKAQLFSYSSNQQAAAGLRLTRQHGLNPASATFAGEDIIISTKIQIPGQHNLQNCLLAAGACLCLGVDQPAIETGISQFKGIFRRYETIYDKDFRVIDDATHNPGNMDAVFSTLSQESPEGLIVVYAIRGNRGKEINSEIAATLRRWVTRLKPRKVIITACTDTASPLDQVQPEEEEVFQKKLARLDEQVVYSYKLRDAVELAVNLVRSNETILLLGAHPMDNVAQLFSNIIGEDVNTLPRPPQFGSAKTH